MGSEMCIRDRLLDITDEGVGMASEEMAHANWRLDNPPVVDVAVSRRMGLFVVARLAARHGIRVRLRPASIGGLTALVWLPDEVISNETTVIPPGLRRFEVAPSAESVPASLADWPEPGQPEDRSAAMEAVNAARTPKFAPLRPDLGDTGAFSAVDADTTTFPAAEAEGTLASAPAEDTLASAPAEDTPTSAPAQETPADAASAPSIPGFQPGQVPSVGAPAGGDDGPAKDHSLGSLRVPTFSAEVGQAAQQGVIVPPPASLGEENRLPIFESVESDWFRRGRHGTDLSARAGTGAASTTTSSDWTSPADAGWEAAEVAHAPLSGGMTVAGLPKRVPQANLVPGGVGAGTSPTSPAPARSAAQTRERMAGFQRGVREGRAAAQDDEAPGGDGDNALYDALCAA